MAIHLGSGYGIATPACIGFRMNPEEVCMHGSKLYVGNLHYATTTKDIETLFSEYGSVEDIKLIEGKGFGFVEMSTQAEAEAAKDKLDGFEFRNRNLKVNEAKPQVSNSRGRNFRR